MNVAPCKGCKIRYVGCHSECIKYIDWQQKLEVIKQNKMDDAEYWGYKSAKARRQI